MDTPTGGDAANSPIDQSQPDPYDAHRYEIDVCKRFVGKVPAHQMGTLNNSFERVEVTPRQHAALIRQGYTTTNPFRKVIPDGGKSPRVEENVIAVTHVALDFDTEDKRSALGTLLSHPVIAEHACFVHPTASSKEGAPRSRVVFVFEHPLSVDQGRQVIQYLQHLFPDADSSTSDTGRIWFGSPDCILHAPGNLVSAETVADWLAAMPAVDQGRGESQPLPNLSINGNGARAEAYGAAALQSGYQIMASAPTGGRNKTMFSQGTGLHELANSGVVTHAEVDQVMQAAAVANGLVADDGQASVDATIASARRKAGDTVRYMPEPAQPYSNGHSSDTAQPGAAGGMPRRYELTDLGNGERFADRYGHLVKYVYPWGWYFWDGARWVKDTTGQVTRWAKETSRSILAEAAGIEDDTQRGKVVRHAMSSQSRSRLEAMLALAQSEPAIAATSEQFDRDLYLLTVANGTLDLRTGQLHPHNPEHYITKMVDIEYIPSAEAPRWLAFLGRIFDHDQDMIRFIQRAIGYTLTGDTSEQCLFFAHGQGRNGKSTLADMIGDLLGDYGQKMGGEALMLKRANTINTEVARLAGARLATSAELNEGRALDESMIKDLLSNEQVTARYLYQQEFSFRPEAKIWISGNHKPRVRGADDGIWRRLRLIPFTVQIPEDEVDKHIADKLRQELPGILAWAVRGCLDWQAHGLQEPASVIAATAKYRSEEDELGAFLDEHCDFGDDLSDGATRLYHAYRELCERNGERAITQTAFGRKLEDRGFDSAPTRPISRLGLQLNAAGGELADAWKARKGG